MPASSSDSAATPPSEPSSAPRRARGWFPAALGVAAAAACWNPLGAPFALVAGAGAAILGVLALRRGASRRVAGAAVVLGAVAAVASVLVLLAAAGVVRRPERELALPQRSDADAARLLDDAAARTREARERAARELRELPSEQPRNGGAAPAR